MLKNVQVMGITRANRLAFGNDAVRGLSSEEQGLRDISLGQHWRHRGPRLWTDLERSEPALLLRRVPGGVLDKRQAISQRVARAYTKRPVS